LSWLTKNAGQVDPQKAGKSFGDVCAIVEIKKLLMATQLVEALLVAAVLKTK